MTLVISLTRRDSIWLLADRRLSFQNLPPKDDARKIAFLETTDGVAILGYAGLGSTARGTEPSDWMNAVLRGRNFPIESALHCLANAAKEQIPLHLIGLPPGARAHGIIAPAFVDDEVRLYAIDLRVAAKNIADFRYTRLVAREGTKSTPGLVFGGSGAEFAKRCKGQLRQILRFADANDRGVLSALTVADQLAALNSDVHHVINSVGPKCIVAWRFRKGGFHKGGGGHQFYTGRKRDADSSILPTVAQGINLSDMLEALLPFNQQLFDAHRLGNKDFKFDQEGLNAEIAKLPHEPDETLR